MFVGLYTDWEIRAKKYKSKDRLFTLIFAKVRQMKAKQFRSNLSPNLTQFCRIWGCGIFLTFFKMSLLELKQHRIEAHGCCAICDDDFTWPEPDHRCRPNKFRINFPPPEMFPPRRDYKPLLLKNKKKKKFSVDSYKKLIGFN